MSKIKVFTTFSGYDSQCLALDRLKETLPDFDYDLVGWSEIAPEAVTAHNLLFPQWSDRNYGDITKIDWEKVPDFDLLTYSSPCQDWSIAGQMRGGAEGSGTRSSLLWECKRAIRAKRPKWLLLENVKMLVSKKFIPHFRRWCDWLTEQGYENFWQVLNAKDFGVPQNRERVFLVSVLRTEQDPWLHYEFPKPFPLQLRLGDLLEDDVPRKYYISDAQLEYFKRVTADQTHNHGFAPTDGKDEVARHVNTREGQRVDANFIIDAAE